MNTQIKNSERSFLTVASHRPGARWTTAMLCGAMVLSLTACGDDDDEAPPSLTPTKAVVAKPASETKVNSRSSDDLGYTYDAVNRRDPFKSYFDELRLVDVEVENLTELQRFELDKLKLVAVIVGTATPMAMVEDPTGKGHTVKIGTLIGKRFGQVKHIRRGEIVVQEEFRDFTGKRIPVYKPLVLEDEAPNPLKK